MNSRQFSDNSLVQGQIGYHQILKCLNRKSIKMLIAVLDIKHVSLYNFKLLVLLVFDIFMHIDILFFMFDKWVYFISILFNTHHL